jgi:hypothetical protein
MEYLSADVLPILLRSLITNNQSDGLPSSRYRANKKSKFIHKINLLSKYIIYLFLRFIASHGISIDMYYP